MNSNTLKTLLQTVRSDSDVVVILSNGREQKTKAPIKMVGDLYSIPLGRVTMFFEAADVSAVQTIEPKPGV